LFRPALRLAPFGRGPPFSSGSRAATESGDLDGLVRDRLTLRAGYSPAGSRFLAPATAGTPRRRCPRQWMFRAAFASRSSTRSQDGQTWVRTERLFRIRSPQPLQSCEVYAGLTASTRLPAHAVLQARHV
jgi:hypothetical protein